MEMDRQTILLIAGGLLSMAMLSGYFLSPQPAAGVRPTYDVHDIRYKYQQSELKAQKRKRAAKGISSDDPAYDSGNDPTNTGDDPNEEPSLDQEPQEEQPLD